ncbi:Rho termination factor N-terminal domain-containing protein, partial [Candidatus Bathyarchaeota archaeon]|nr:Rho termination factor N-terminal domain-containing protein [Candidatus Bathyarchaeota archaeon]
MSPSEVLRPSDFRLVSGRSNFQKIVSDLKIKKRHLTFGCKSLRRLRQTVNSSLDEAELMKMKVSELRRLAEDLGIESPSKKLKTRLITDILQKQKFTGELEAKKRVKPKIEKIIGTILNFKTGMHRQEHTHILIGL